MTIEAKTATWREWDVIVVLVYQGGAYANQNINYTRFD
jgi:hypothetical protein